MNIVSRIRLSNGRTCAAFARTDDDKVLLTAMMPAPLKRSELSKMFRAAHDYWDIPFGADIVPQTFSGALVMPTRDESLTFQKLREEFGFEWHGDLTVPTPIFIIGGNIADITDAEIMRLAPYWGNAMIFTLRGFENYLRRDIKDNREDQNLYSLLKRCEYIEDGYFRWPHTNCFPGRGVFAPGWMREKGVLSEMGYHVGRTNGLGVNARRQILDEAYSSSVPYIDEDNMVEWNSPRTPFRLKKMANVLAAMARNFKRRNDARFNDAIAEWESDLAYLKIRYYNGRYDRSFPWPNTWPGR